MTVRPWRLVARTSDGDKPYLVLVAPNGEDVLVGEEFESWQACEDTAEAIGQFSGLALRDDREG